ncbi:MAG: DUF3800 domain-containing protein [Propionivibrio sp.]
MYICYVNEAGCTGALPDSLSSIQPVFTLVGLFIKQTHVRSITNQWIQIKQRFFPNLLPTGAPYHNWMTAEIKGADLRRSARSSRRNDRRFAYGVIGEGLKLLENHGAMICGRVYVKPIGDGFDGAAVYGATVQGISEVFQKFLEEKNARGLMIADSRNKPKNANVSHSIFTQRYRAGGDPYERLIELPTFGHSDNHAGLQLTDLICSALLFPIAAEVCCSRHLADHTHCHANYLNLRTRYGEQIKNLQYRYQGANGWWHGGLKLIDPLNSYRPPVLFKQT